MPIRAVLTNIGSLGNIQPFLALAYELRRTGYIPILALAPQYRSYVESLNFEFAPLGHDLDYSSLQRKDTEAALQGRDPLDMMYDSIAIMRPMMQQMFEELMETSRHADLLISGHLQPASRMIHELTGLPFVSVHTNHFGHTQPLSFRQAACSLINPFRLELGLKALSDPLHTEANSPQLALYAISRYLRKPNPNWPKHFHVTGFFYLDDAEWIPPTELADFLKEGPPPVVFSFSSITHRDPQAITELILEAIERVNCRAIVQSGWSGLAKDRPLPSNVFSVGFVQHTWLFPRAACVVHAGGSGTPATALRSGVPAIVVPHIGDQPMWAELVKGLGCAKEIIPYSDLTVERLAAALQNTITDTRLHDRAKAVSHQINSERGVVRATQLITDLLIRTGVLADLGQQTQPA